MVVIINLRFGVGWMSDRNGAWRGAAPRGAAPHFGTICLEVLKAGGILVVPPEQRYNIDVM